MAVRLAAPTADSLHPVSGVRLGIARAGIRKPNRKDLLLVVFDEGTAVAGVFTRNRFCAAPVHVCREHLARSTAIRALLVNTGNANAGTGAPGMADARTMCAETARHLDVDAANVLPFSTGVIMERLPIDRVVAGIPACIADLSTTNWLSAAEAIMTTDTLPKAASRRVVIDGDSITVTGVAKGAGMIHPNMATMLGFITTDARVTESVLQAMLREVADRSFNAVTVDGDTSTNDSLILAATNKNGPRIDASDGDPYFALRDAVEGVAYELAHAIIRDGEGATKFITVHIEQGRDEAECRKIAFAIAHSPLVKTAFFASDPNLGRILAAIGYAGIDDLDVEKIGLYLDEVSVVKDGGRDPSYREEHGQAVMKREEITIRVLLQRGAAQAKVWTCDLSHDYVTINAEYRT